MMEGGRGVLGRGARNLRDAWVAKDMEIGLGPRVASGTCYFIARWASTGDTLGLWAPAWFWFMHICIMLPYTEQLGSFVCMYYVRARARAHTHTSKHHIPYTSRYKEQKGQPDLHWFGVHTQ